MIIAPFPQDAMATLWVVMAASAGTARLLTSMLPNAAPLVGGAVLAGVGVVTEAAAVAAVVGEEADHDVTAHSQLVD